MNLDLIKSASGMIVSAGVGTIVGNIVKNNTPEDLKTYRKVLVKIGGFALSGMAGAASVAYVEKQIDQLEAGVKAGIALGEAFNNKKVVVVDKNEEEQS